MPAGLPMGTGGAGHLSMTTDTGSCLPTPGGKLSAPFQPPRRARSSLALAAALATLTVSSIGFAATPAAVATSADASGSAAAETAQTRRVAELTRLEGVDGDGPFSLTTVEVDGAPVVTGTDADGTDSRGTPGGDTGGNDRNVTAAAQAQTRDANGTASLDHAYVDAPAGASTNDNDNDNDNARDLSQIVEQAATGSVPRLGAASVYDTAVAVSQRAFAPGSADTVYITRADRVGDALAAGALSDGPVLFVPRTGTAPANVIAEVRRVGARRVIALGGEAAVSASVLTSAASGRPTSRLAGANSYETAAAIARRAFPSGAPEVYLAGLKQGPGGVVSDSPDAAAGGVLTPGPVLPVPSQGPVPQIVKDTVNRLSAGRVYALGGTAAVSARALGDASSGRPTARLTGADRYATSAAIARHAFPGGARVAYLVAGTSLAEAVAGGALTDGPILFTPPAGTTYRSQAAAISGVLTRLGVTSVGALSPSAALPVSAVEAVVSASPVTLGPLPEYPGSTPEPAPTPTSTPTPTSSPTPTNTPTNTPPPTSTPTSTPPPTTAPAPVAQSCEVLVGSFRPIPLPHPYTIGCVNSIQGDSRILGLTSTRIYLDDESVASGSIQIVRGISESMLKTTIAHEIAHAFSYGSLTRTQRSWFVGALRSIDPYVVSNDFNDDTSYDRMPAEQWARGQASCVGYPDPYNRPTAPCSLIDGTIASPR